MSKIFIFLFFCLIFLSACDIINPAEDIPSFIHIDKFSLITTSEQGTNSHKITDAWVYVDGNFNGVYELPVTFPVLNEGKHEIKLYPGIKIFGIASSREIYPFYKNFVAEKDLKPKNIDTISPTVYYFNELNFSELWMEDFGDEGIKLDTIFNGNVKLEQILDTVLNSKVGFINLTEDNNIFDCKSEELDLPKYSKRVYLEINYKCNHDFTIGLWANLSSSTLRYPIIQLNPHPDSWNKAYIDLTQTTTANPNAYDFSLFITAILNDGSTSGKIYIDNLKIIHF